MAVAAEAEGGAATTATTYTRSLQETPTWAVATVIMFFIVISLIIEHLIHLLVKWLKRKRKTSLVEAVARLQSELIILGFMSLILAVTQKPISKICVSNKVAYTMLPCRHTIDTKTTKTVEDISWPIERQLASESDSTDYCEAKGMTSMISQQGITQLQIFIFVLALMQIGYSILTMALGRAKMKSWKTWEKETQTIEYQAANDPNRFRFAKQTTFGRRHMNSGTSTTPYLWIKCFFRQFFHSVAKVDYLTLRHGFITAHLSTNQNFNFQKYIQRSLEDDFKVVVGIRPFMWLILVIFMLVDVHGWHVYLWVSFIPLFIVLTLGTKMEIIVARMALQLKDQHSVIKGTPLVQPNDNLFWFNHPKYVLTLLHFTLFMNAFEVAFFIWVTTQFGIKSCYHEHPEIIAVRVVLAVTVQVMCSYITLPLYALVTQMGTHFKSGILEEQTTNVIKQWHKDVRGRRKKQPNPSNRSPRDSPSPSSTSSRTSTSSQFDYSSHHRRSPTFAEITIPSSEITEVVEDESNPPLASSSSVVQIEMPEVNETRSRIYP